MLKGYDHFNTIEIPGISFYSQFNKINMSHIDFFDHPQKKQNKEYFVHLVRIAKADDIMSHTELELLDRIGKKLGFADPEIKKLIETTGKSDYNPPYELSKRFDQVYEIVKMTLADGQIGNQEMRLANAFAVKSRFDESDIPSLMALLIHGIREGKDEEELFEKYMKNRKF